MIRRTMRWCGPILPAVLFFTASALEAATFNPTNAGELQTALETASANNEDDLIQLSEGDYLGVEVGGGFSYSSGEVRRLTIQGAGIGKTRLVGNGSSNTIYIGAGGSGSHGVIVSGISFSGGDGSGVSAESDNASLTVEDCEFSENQLGLFFDTIGAKVTVRGNLFHHNESTGMYLSGGAEISIRDNVFRDNRSEAAPAQVETGDTQVSVLDNLFIGNSVSSGPGALLLSGENDIEISGNRFLNNFSATAASALDLSSYDGDVFVIGNLFAGNDTGELEGVLHATYAEDFVMVNNTVSGNSAEGRVGGLFLAPTEVANPTFLYNNILEGNTIRNSIGGFLSDLYLEDGVSGTGNPVTLSHNLIGFYSHTCIGAVGCASAISEIAAVSGDPLFFDAENRDFNLQAASPALGAGDPGAPRLPSVDLEGRALSDPPDLGAFAAAGRLVADPLTLDFGSLVLGAESTQEISLSNPGALDLNITALSLSDEGNYSLDTSACGGAKPTLAPGASCVLGVTYAPEAVGSHSGTLSVQSSDPTQGSIDVSLNGNATASGNGGEDLGGDGGCSLGSATPAGFYSLMLMIPLLWGLRRFRK